MLRVIRWSILRDLSVILTLPTESWRPAWKSGKSKKRITTIPKTVHLGRTWSTSATPPPPILTPWLSGRGKERPSCSNRTIEGLAGAYGVITATMIGPGDENE